MRNNFDFVTMSNYESDMREASELAARAIYELKKDSDFWRHAFWEAVAKSGGSIRIYLEKEPGAIARAKLCDDGQEVVFYQDDFTYEFRLTPPS